MILLANLIFIKAFSLWCWRPTSKQAFFHLLRPLLDFLVQVIVFYNVACVFFKLTSRNPTHTIRSLQTYWHVLLKACPKNVQSMNLPMELQVSMAHRRTKSLNNFCAKKRLWQKVHNKGRTTLNATMCNNRELTKTKKNLSRTKKSKELV